jgi:hypothetical protein
MVADHQSIFDRAWSRADRIGAPHIPGTRETLEHVSPSPKGIPRNQSGITPWVFIPIPKDETRCHAAERGPVRCNGLLFEVPIDGVAP